MAKLGEGIGKLGFGLMRLPRLEDGTIDIEQMSEMVDCFLDAGFTYFDTAFVYQGSEEAARKALVERHPRESYQLATKSAAWAGCKTAEEAQAQFTQSLERTGAGYIDFFLLHNLGGARTETFAKFGMYDFAQELKAKGLVKHVGFSMHDRAATLDEVLTNHPEMEFVQLQINYLDWENPIHECRKCLEVAAKHQVPVVVMEPIRGGLLAQPPATVEKVFKDAEPDSSCASWALRFAASQPGVITVLSGMSTIDQMRENVATMKGFTGLTDQQMDVIHAAQDEFAKFDLVPCTGCNYCAKVCPEHVGISGSLLTLNAYTMFGRFVQEWLVAGSGNAKPTHCIECGACVSVCPQGIDIPEKLKKAAELFRK